MRQGKPIERIGTVSNDVFLRDYAGAGRPLILTGLMDAWPARQRWSPDYLIQRCADHRFTVDKQTFTAQELFDTLAQPDQEPNLYLHNHYLEEQLPQLIEDVAPLPEMVTDNLLWHPRWPPTPLTRKGRIGLFIGAAGSAFPVLHRDNFHTHAFIFQVLGTKRVWLYDPAQTPLLYANPRIPTHSVIETPYELDAARYPDFAKAEPLSDVLAPGETLFVPDYWWHATYMDELSISLSMNVVNQTNIKGFATDCRREWQQKAPLKAWLRYARLRAFAAGFHSLGRKRRSS